MAIEPKKIQDDRQYKVVLKERIVVSDVVLCPGWDIELRGDLVKKHAEAIDSATPV